MTPQKIIICPNSINFIIMIPLNISSSNFDMLNLNSDSTPNYRSINQINHMSELKLKGKMVDNFPKQTRVSTQNKKELKYMASLYIGQNHVPKKQK